MSQQQQGLKRKREREQEQVAGCTCKRERSEDGGDALEKKNGGNVKEEKRDDGVVGEDGVGMKSEKQREDDKCLLVLDDIS